MNRFYQVIQTPNGSKFQDKLDLHLGDKVIPTDIGCFELFFQIDAENQIKKMECNFYLGDIDHISAHPEFFYVDLPTDLLVPHPSHTYTMAITDKDCLDEVSRFTKEFNEETRSWYSSNDIEDARAFDDVITSERKRHQKYIEAPNGTYETIELPNILKWRCNKYKHFPNCDSFKRRGWLFQFATSVPKILSQITYNTLNQCSIEQYHGGVGNNEKR